MFCVLLCYSSLKFNSSVSHILVNEPVINQVTKLICTVQLQPYVCVCLCATGVAACCGPAPAEWGEKGLLWVSELSASSVQLFGNTSLRWPTRLLSASHTGQQLRRFVCVQRELVKLIEKNLCPLAISNFILCICSQSNISLRWLGARSSLI